MDDTLLWHMNIGESGMIELQKRNLLKRVKSCKLNLCKFCILAKQHWVQFKIGKHSTEAVLDYVRLTHGDQLVSRSKEDLSTSSHSLVLYKDLGALHRAQIWDSRKVQDLEGKSWKPDMQKNRVIDDKKWHKYKNVKFQLFLEKHDI